MDGVTGGLFLCVKNGISKEIRPLDYESRFAQGIYEVLSVAS
jgi:hypothetical protein